MIDFLEPQQLFFTITNLKIHDHSQFMNLDPCIKALVKNEEFPIIDVTNVYKKYQNECQNEHDLIKLMKMHNFAFSFDTNCLNLIVSTKSFCQTSPDYIIAIVLYSYLSWISLYFSTQNVGNVDILLKSLINLLQIRTSKNINKPYLLIASACYHIFSDIVETINFDVNLILHPLVEFFTANLEYPEKAFFLISKIANHIIDKYSSSFSKEAIHFINFVILIMNSCEKNYPSSVTEEILLLMKNALIGLDDTALIYFERSISSYNQLTESFLIDIINFFPKGIIKFIDHNKISTISDEILPSLKDDEIILPSHYQYEKESLMYQDNDTNIIPEEPPDFPNILSLSEVIDKTLLKKLLFLGKIFHEKNINENILNALLDSIILTISNLKLPYYYDCLSSLLCLAYFLSPKQPIPKFPTDILLTNLFSQHITVFYENESFIKINTIRYLFFLLLLNQNEFVIQQSFELIKVKPLIYAEFVYRFLPDFSNIKHILLFSKAILDGITSSIIYYLKLQRTIGNHSLGIKKAEFTSVTYLNIVFKIPDIRKIFFESSHFISIIISFFFEPAMRQWTLNCIKETLTLQNLMNEPLIDFCIQLYKIIFDSKYSANEIDQAEALIIFLNNKEFNDPKLAKSFDQVISFICKWIANLPKENEKSTSILNKMLDIFLRFSNTHSLSELDMWAVETASHTLFENEPPETFFTKILQYTSGNYDYYNEKNYKIKHPLGLILLIRIFKYSKKFIHKLEFVEEICRNNMKNCNKCSNSEFDLYLIDLLSEYRNDSKISKEIFDKILSIFIIISYHSSSVLCVQQFIALLCPINSSILPRFYNEVFEAISTLLLQSRKVPPMALPIVSSTEIQANQINIPKNFSISFWYFVVDTSFNPITIVNISNENYLFSLKLKNQCFYISIQIGDDQWSNEFYFEESIPLNKWNFTTLSIQIENDRVIIHPIINGVYAQMLIFPFFDFSSSLSKVTLGITDNTQYIVFLGSFSISNYIDLLDSITLFDIGPRNMPMNSLFSFSFYDRNNYFSIDSYPADIDVKMKKVRILHKPSFVDILIDVCGLSILLPIVSHSNLCFINGNKEKYLLESFVDILEIGLMLSKNSQKIFSGDKGFLILSNLLKTNKISLTYKIFHKFCSIFELLNYKKCKSQLLFGLLLNIDLWICSESIELKKILYYWSSALMPTHIDLILKKMGFCDIISLLRIFFWYEPIEQETIMGLERKITLTDDIKACRNYLLSCAYLMAKKGLSYDEYSFLISQILTISDNLQVYDLLSFVQELNSINNEVRSKQQNVMDPISNMVFLYSGSDDILELVLDILNDACNKKIIEGASLLQKFDYFMNNLPKQYISNKILSKIIKICISSSPELFSFCSMISFYIGTECIIDFLNLFSIIPLKIYSHSFWFLWLVISIYKNNDLNFRQKVIDFLINSAPEQWSNIFWTIHIIGCAFEVNQDYYKFLFIKNLSIKMQKMEKFDEDQILNYFNLVQQYLFLINNSEFCKNITKESQRIQKRSLTIPNSAKKCESVRSPLITPKNKSKVRSFTRRRSSSFSSDNLLRSSSQSPFDKVEYDNQFLCKELILSLGNLKNDCCKIFFGLRLSETNHWDDIEIAEIANDIFIKFPNFKYYNQIIFIDAYLILFDVQKVIPTLHIIQREQLEESGELSLYNMHVYKLNIYHKLIKHPNNPTSETNLNSLSEHFSKGLQSKDLYLYNHNEEFNENDIEKKYSQKSFIFLQMFEKKYYGDSKVQKLYSFLKTSQLLGNEFYRKLESDMSVSSSEFISNSKELITLNNTKYNKYWNHFWRLMTTERAPWFKAGPFTTKKILYYKRDFTLCSYLCPYKLRQNNLLNNQMNQINSLHNDNIAYKQESQYSFIKNSLYSDADDSLSNTSFSLLDLNTFSDTDSYILRNPLIKALKINIFGYQNNFFENDSESFTDTDESQNEESVIPFESKCLFESECQIITVGHIINANFSLQKNCIVIYKNRKSAKIIKIENILAVYTRTHMQRQTAIEIFFDDGSSFFLNFQKYHLQMLIEQFQTLKRCHPFLLQVMPPKQFIQTINSTSQWIKREISNFEYLMILNNISGRSFNNIYQYPIFPWILCDYESASIDLNDQTIYRDLSKPVGALNLQRIQILDDFFKKNSYFYSTCYTSSLSITNWLVRLEPFSSLHVNYNNGHFCQASKIFASIRKEFNIVTSLENDFRELIPEFFYSPDFLINTNHFNIGDNSGNVELPKWVFGNNKNIDIRSPYEAAYEFVYINRKALESEFVSQHLNEWIDLIWGDKQNGNKAANAKNVFRHEMYPDVWETDFGKQHKNEEEIHTILTFVGQIPHQLFDKPHPPRLPNHSQNNNIFLSYNIDTTSKIFISTLEVKKNELSFLLINEKGSCQNLQLNFKYFQEKFKKEQSIFRRMSGDHMLPKLHYSTIQNPESLHQTKWLYIDNQQFLVVDKQHKCDIFLIHTKTGQLKRIIRQRNDVITCDYDGKWFAVATKDSKVQVYSTKDFKMHISISSFGDLVNCCSLSSQFHSLVCGTRDNSLMIYSLSNCSLVRIVEINSKPLLCITTHSWGFNVLYSSSVKDGNPINFLALYSINGDFIKKVQISISIVKMLSWSDNKGFDYVLLLDENNSIYAFEAFTLEISRPLYVSKEKIISIHYMKAKQYIVAICDNGKINFIPFSYN